MFIRTKQGVTLTKAGKSIYEDAVEMIKQSHKAIQRVYKEQEASQLVIRVGTSALYPCSVLMDIWNKISEKYPQFKLKKIPYGIIYSSDAGQEIKCFIKAVKENF